MSSSDPQGRPGEEQQAAAPPPTDTPAGRSRTAGVRRTETLRALQGQLDLALSKHYLGDDHEAVEILRAVLSSPEEASTGPVTVEGFEGVGPSALRGVAYALLGQIQDRRGQDDEKLAAFNRAVALFEEERRRGGGLPARYYGEYGLALRMIGRVDDAREYLRLANEHRFSTPETYRHLGLILKEDGRYDEAVDEFQKALKLRPDDPLIHKALGETFEAAGETDAAIMAYHKAAYAMESAHRLGQAVEMMARVLRLNPQSPTGLFGMGMFLYKLGRYKEALQALNRVPESDPNYVLALGTKGDTLRMLGRYEDALQVLERASGLDPDYEFAFKTKRRVLRALGRSEEAVEELRRAVERNPQAAWAHAELGKALRTMGNHEKQKRRFGRASWHYEQALQELDQALALDPDYALALGSRGDVLRELGRYEEALQELNQALAADPNYVWALGTKGDTLRMLERYEEALQALDQALALDPRYAFALGTKGIVLYALGRYDEALQKLDQALKHDPNYALALGTKGQILCDAAYYEEALQVLERAERLGNSFEDWIFAVKGWALEKLGADRAREAREQYERALKLEPKHPWLQKALGNALYLLDDEGFKDAYRSAIKEASKLAEEWHAGAMALLGWCYCRLGEYDQAIQFLDNAISFYPGLVSAQFDFGLTLMCSGKHHSEALHQYDSALKLAWSKHPLPRRGALHVAMQDLDLAVEKSQVKKEDVEEVQGRLEEAREEATAAAERTLRGILEESP